MATITYFPPAGGVDPGVAFTAPGNVASIDFTGLTATSGGWEIKYELILPTGVDVDVLMRFNTIATGYHSAGVSNNALTSSGFTNSGGATGIFGSGTQSTGHLLGRAGLDGTRDKMSGTTIVQTLTGNRIYVRTTAHAYASASNTSPMTETVHETFSVGGAVSQITIVLSAGNLQTGSYMAIRPTSFLA